MIEQIQNLIEDHTSFDITRNQIIMALAVVIAFALLIIIIAFQVGGPKEDPKNMSTPKPSTNLPVHVPGQK